MDPLDKQTSNSNAASTFKLSVGWMKFLAILAFVGAGLTVFGSFAQMQYMPMLGITTFLSGGVYCVIGIFLLNYANATNNFADNSSESSLENMAEHHTKYWKITGILVICLVGVSIIIGLATVAAYGSAYGRFRF